MENLKIKDVSLKIFSGGTPSTKNKEFWDGDLNWLSSGETKNLFIKNTQKTITKLGAEKSSTRLAKAGDIVIASAGQGFTRGQTSFLKIDTYINQSLIAIRPDLKIIKPLYLFHILYKKYDELRFLSNSTSTRGSITIEMIKNLNITVHNLDVQQHIVNIISILLLVFF